MVPSAIRIRREVVEELAIQARQRPESECCGLLAGRNGMITRAFHTTNAAVDPETSYEIAPADLFRLMRAIRSARLELMGIYHSHPNGKNEPSVRDIEGAYYPHTAYFILSPRPDSPRPARAFSIRDGRAIELEIYAS